VAVLTYASSSVDLVHNYHKRMAKQDDVLLRDDLGAAFMGLDLQSLMLVNT